MFNNNIYLYFILISKSRSAEHTGPAGINKWLAIIYLSMQENSSAVLNHIIILL